MSSTTKQPAVTKAVRPNELVSSKDAHLQNQNTDDALIVELIEALVSIDIASPLAKLNETSIADNNGGRILL